MAALARKKFVRLRASRNWTRNSTSPCSLILVGGTIVAGRAGEAITELILAMKHNLKLTDLAAAIHVYPTYSTAVQQLAAEFAIHKAMSGLSGRVIRGLSKII